MPGYCPAPLAPLPVRLVQNIPPEAEHLFGRRQKVFAFPAESLFPLRTECCSESQRNGVCLHTGSRFALDRIPQAGVGGSIPSTATILSIACAHFINSRIHQLDHRSP